MPTHQSVNIIWEPQCQEWWKSLTSYSTCKLKSLNFLNVGRRHEMLGCRGRSIYLSTQQAALSMSIAGVHSSSPNSQRDGKRVGDTCTYGGLCYRRGNLSLRNLNLLHQREVEVQSISSFQCFLLQNIALKRYSGKMALSASICKMFRNS